MSLSCPPATTSAIPRPPTKSASVATIGCTPTNATRDPLTSPTATRSRGPSFCLVVGRVAGAGTVARDRGHDPLLGEVAPAELADDRAVLQDHDAVGSLDQLLQVGGDQQHAEPVFGEFVDQRLD